MLEALAAEAGVSVDEIKAELAYRWDGWLARPDQLPPPGDWRFWFIKAGRGYGKTRLGAEETRAAVKRGIRYPNIIGATADDARDIMIEGESGILAVCPKLERPLYQPSKRQLEWPNGAKTLIFTADEPERLRGKQHEWLWADEVAAWRYPEAWDQAMFGLRLGENPQAVVTSTPKPTELVRDLLGNPHTVVTHGATYDNIQNLAPAFAAEIIAKYEGTRLGRQELLGEVLDDEGLAYPWRESLHVIDAFTVPPSFERFEFMDFGSSESSATAWYVAAVDYDGNTIVLDGYYQPGLPSVTAPEIFRLREQGWEARGEDGSRIPHLAYGDPAIFNPGQTTNKWGQPAVVADEFSDLGVRLVRANNDRRAGYVRISELLKPDGAHLFPAWHKRAGGEGSPRLFFMDVPGTLELREQVRWAPLEETGPGPHAGPFPGEAVAVKWESGKAHGHAALRYGMMSRPSPSSEPQSWRQELLEPVAPPETLRAAALRQREEALDRPPRRRAYTRV